MYMQRDIRVSVLCVCTVGRSHKGHCDGGHNDVLKGKFTQNHFMAVVSFSPLPKSILGSCNAVEVNFLLVSQLKPSLFL